MPSCEVTEVFTCPMLVLSLKWDSYHLLLLVRDEPLVIVHVVWRCTVF